MNDLSYDVRLVGLDEPILNEDNPRDIGPDEFKGLVDSVLMFPRMLWIRPIVVDGGGVVLGGNMRVRSLRYIGGLDGDEFKKRIRGIRQFKKASKQKRDFLLEWWERWQEMKVCPVVCADDLDDDQKKEFIIKDNGQWGEWNLEMLANQWDVEDLQDWGVGGLEDIWRNEEEAVVKETERLSEVKFDTPYYQPEQVPNIRLRDCIDTEKFEAKVKALDEYELSDEQKEVLKMFAYRFLKIDFESVANYYAFNASEEEKKAIERLRLVLVDGGVNGFIEDDLLRVMSITDSSGEGDDDEPENN